MKKARDREKEKKKEPREGTGTPLQSSCLENPMDGGAWWAAIHAWSRYESDMTERLHFHKKKKKKRNQRWLMVAWRPWDD